MIFFSWTYEGKNKILVQISVQISFKIWNKWAYIYYKGDGYYSLEVLILKKIWYIHEMKLVSTLHSGSKFVGFSAVMNTGFQDVSMEADFWLKNESLSV